MGKGARKAEQLKSKFTHHPSPRATTLSLATSSRHDWERRQSMRLPQELLHHCYWLQETCKSPSRRQRRQKHWASNKTRGRGCLVWQANWIRKGHSWVKWSIPREVWDAYRTFPCHVKCVCSAEQGVNITKLLSQARTTWLEVTFAQWCSCSRGKCGALPFHINI